MGSVAELELKQEGVFHRRKGQQRRHRVNQSHTQPTEPVDRTPSFLVIYFSSFHARANVACLVTLDASKMPHPQLLDLSCPLLLQVVITATHVIALVRIATAAQMNSRHPKRLTMIGSDEVAAVVTTETVRSISKSNWRKNRQIDRYTNRDIDKQF